MIISFLIQKSVFIAVIIAFLGLEVGLNFALEQGEPHIDKRQVADLLSWLKRLSNKHKDRGSNPRVGYTIFRSPTIDIFLILNYITYILFTIIIIINK